MNGRFLNRRNRCVLVVAVRRQMKQTTPVSMARGLYSLMAQ